MIQSIEAVRCLEEGVLQAAIDADVGAILGWGYPAFRGGPLGWLHTLGLPKALATCERLELAHGSRFAAPQRLRQMAQQGQTFF